MRKIMMMIMMLTGLSVGLTANAETEDEIIEKMNENTKKEECVSADMKINFDASAIFGKNEENIRMNLALSVDEVASQPGMYINGSISMDTGEEAEEIPYEAYIIPQEDADGKMLFYSSLANSAWAVTETEMFDSDNLIADLVSDDAMEYNLDSELHNIDGTDCYLLTCNIDSDAMNRLVRSALNETATGDNEESIQMAVWMLDGLQLNFNIYADTENCLPVSITIDMNDSDLSNLTAFFNLFAEIYDTAEMELQLNDLSMVYKVNYDDMEDITVPDDVTKNALKANNIFSGLMAAALTEEAGQNDLNDEDEDYLYQMIEDLETDTNGLFSFGSFFE